MKAAHELTLGEAVDLIYYGANCETCHETRRIDLHALLLQVGADYPCGDVRRRLVCSKCGRRDVIVVTLWQDATTTPKLMEHWR